MKKNSRREAFVAFLFVGTLAVLCFGIATGSIMPKSCMAATPDDLFKDKYKGAEVQVFDHKVPKFKIKLNWEGTEYTTYTFSGATEEEVKEVFKILGRTVSGFEEGQDFGGKYKTVKIPGSMEFYSIAVYYDGSVRYEYAGEGRKVSINQLEKIFDHFLNK